MGPKKDEKPFELSVFDRVKYDIRRSVTEYFNKPTKYTFYLFLSLLLVALLAEKEVAWQYYLILILLAAKEFNIFSYAKKISKKVCKKKK